jgi:hypothetical protein
MPLRGDRAYRFAGIEFGSRVLASLEFGVTYAATGTPQASGGYFDISAPNDGVCVDCAPGSAEVLLSAKVSNQ